MMTKESCIKHIEKYEDRADTSNALKEIEDALSSNKIDFKNIISIITYNRDDCIELSLLTSPSYDINIKMKKLS